MSEEGYTDLLEQWSRNKKKDTANLSKLQQSDHLLHELAILECMKSVSIASKDPS